MTNRGVRRTEIEVMSDQVPDGVDWRALGTIHSTGRIAESKRHSKKARTTDGRARLKTRQPKSVRGYSKLVAPPVLVMSHFSKASLLSTTMMPADIEE